MNTYQKLLSVDPIGAFEKIKQNYLRYFKTSFKLRDEELDNRKNDILQQDDNLYKEPYFEILPEYIKATKEDGSEANCQEDLLDRFDKGFKDPELTKEFTSKFLTKGLLKNHPYGHQMEMYEKVFAEGKNTVITSGTGSGKTEAFLMPVLAQIFKEAKEWPRPDYEHDQWYLENGVSYDQPYQRMGENRKSAVRAMIVYPMNALVEDQMTRLREALDCDDVRKHFDKEDGLKGNRIFFGRYNGATIGKQSLGKVGKDAKKRCFEQLSTIVRQSDELLQYYEQTRKSDAQFIGPRITTPTRTAEMITRWDMQENPPDILITNFSMLSIMLMRQAEDSIFAKTREWLEESKENIFHLIIDELHLFRGTAGSEIAYLMRMFLDTIGLPPVIENEAGHIIPNPQLRILASSASLGSQEETLNYLEEFFGVYHSNNTPAFHIQTGTDYIPCDQKIPIDYQVFNTVGVDYPFKSGEEQIQVKASLAQALGFENLAAFFEEHKEQIFADFNKAASNDTKRVVPISQTVLVQKLFKGDENALRGFLMIRADEEINEIEPLPRIRFHQFFKYVEGLWAELLPQANNNETLGKLMYRPLEVVEHDEKIHKVLEMMRCEGCGAAFVGGNKTTDPLNGGNRISLSLNAPELHHIPNTNPTPMVQNKWYHEYAVFWPTEKNPDLDENSKFYMLKRENGLIKRADFRVRNRAGLYEYGQTKTRANWKEAYLDPFTGIVSWIRNGNPDLIRGYIYVLLEHHAQSNNNFTLNCSFNPGNYDQKGPFEAMPHICPACKRDYTKRIYTKSPIRSFRTGISRSNQILSKELIYQLSGDKPKLLGFSDSRQDAADQAYGIEREHYRDMIRALFMECVQELTQVNPRIAELIEATHERGYEIMTTVNNEFADIENRLEIVSATVDDYESSIEMYLSPEETFSLSDLLGERLDGMLIQKLLKLGINPHGVEYKKQSVYHHGKLYHWSLLYDFTNFKLDTLGNIQHKISPTFVIADTVIDGVWASVYASIFQNSFGRYMDLDTESAGVGYITFQIGDVNLGLLKNRLPTEIDAEEFLNGFLRVMGNHYRYHNPENDFRLNNFKNYGDFPAFLTKPIQRICSLHPTINEDALGNAVYNTVNLLLRNMGEENFVLNPGRLQFRRVSENSEYFKCSSCGKIHLHRGMGICCNTHCLNPLPEERTGGVQEIWDNNFIAYDLLQEKREPIRLHTEELTGQTDNQAQRQLEFKGIIVNSNPVMQRADELAKEIDMINVTTTMEVGVDIGNLEAVFQGNMPPTRYNYQQRVGRGGRRKQAFSSALTFCRGRSHDTYYYHEATDTMLGSVPVAPKLSIAPILLEDGQHSMKISIPKRMLTKNILKLAFRTIHPFTDDDSRDTHGEFGDVDMWEGMRIPLEQWIQSNQNLIKDYIVKYLSQFNTEETNIEDDMDSIKQWFENSLVGQINQAVRQSIHGGGIAQALAEAGLLPMFGMPSGQRVLYHGLDYSMDKIKEIDRNLELSITEFAPGAIKTKDKGFYESAGLTIPLRYQKQYNKQNPIHSMFKFEDNPERFDALEFSYHLHLDEDSNIESIQAYQEGLEENDLIKRLVIPKSYRTQKIRANTGLKSENSDIRSNYTTSTIFAEEAGTASEKTLENCSLSLYELTDNSSGTIWRINTNNGNFFQGKSCHQYTYGKNNEVTDPVIDGCGDNIVAPNFIIDEYQNIGESNFYSGEIALGAKKVTEMVKIELKEIPNELCLDISTGNAPAIKSAFYSAAYLLKRVLADKLDVEPKEIEISELKINSETGVPYFFLNDALPNGAGFVSYLFEKDNFKNIIAEIVNLENKYIKFLASDDHMKECKTSCQKCLNSYDNAGYHHILDWRLGIGLLRLMIKPDFTFGIHGDFQDYGELTDLVRLINGTCNLLSRTNQGQLETSAPGINYLKLDNTNIFIGHPLWNKHYISQHEMHYMGDIHINKIMDFFTLLRTNHFPGGGMEEDQIML